MIWDVVSEHEHEHEHDTDEQGANALNRGWADEPGVGQIQIDSSPSCVVTMSHRHANAQTHAHAHALAHLFVRVLDQHRAGREIEQTTRTRGYGGVNDYVTPSASSVFALDAGGSWSWSRCWRRPRHLDV
jgi:hypothetical protein